MLTAAAVEATASASSPLLTPCAVGVVHVGARGTAVAGSPLAIGARARGSLMATSLARDDQTGTRHTGVMGAVVAELLEGVASLQALFDVVDRSRRLSGVTHVEVGIR